MWWVLLSLSVLSNCVLTPGGDQVCMLHLGISKHQQHL